MFRKAHLLFTLLCAGTTSAIMILMSFLYLHVSENSLYENQFHSFQNDIGTITMELEDTASLSIQWLTRMEAQNHYTIYVIDNGVPFLYNALRNRLDSNNRKLFAESLEACHNIIGKGISYSGIWHTEYEFFSSTTNNTYYCSFIDIDRGGTTSQIIILSSLRTLDTQVFRQRVLFACLDFAAIILFCVFSWIFTGRLLKPLRENHEAQMQFIAAASHELRTPLSVILASSECCQSASVEEQTGFFQTIRNEGKRMERLIDDMLTLARLGANRFLIERKPVQLDTLCLNAFEAFEPLCQNKNLTLLLILPEEALPRYQCDASRIAQVLSILLHNALSYTPENGQITLELVWYKDNECFEISVTDNGIGISDADKKHIFERFYRAEKSRSTKGHFGLGLSIAYEIVAAHHGKINVTDNPGGGSVFTVRLP
ncbi:MAG: HAMP domain-containing histidine kinase [Clostridium sp.]|nr:HAMP domain-containing histidine kinase [Clostridium sp.]